MFFRPVRIGPERWVVPANCACCLIEVSHSQKDDDWKWVSVSLTSTSVGMWNQRLRTRIKDAWRILTGNAWTYFEMTSADEMDGLLSALEAARAEAFGPGPRVVATAGDNTTTIAPPPSA